MSASMEERLKRRKLDALKRGVHRVTGGESLPLTTHVVGIGKAGASVIAQILRDLEPDAPKLSALAVDIGDQDLQELRALSDSIPKDRADVTILCLDVPDHGDLFDALENYGSFLRLEYPSSRWAATTQPWLERSIVLPDAGQHFDRAIAKAIYGYAYYAASRPAEKVLRAFAEGIDANHSQAVVAIVFGMGGGTGSGIAVDLARHLSNGLFGRRVLVAGIGIAPCDGDKAGAELFSVISELDVLGDENKNKGVVMSCGDMFRNPFTAGFIMVPQNHIWRATQDLAETNRRASQEISSLFTIKGGTNLWEVLRLLNWVAAPSTQHSAARTPWGQRWIHMLGFTDTIRPGLRRDLGLLPAYIPEFIEARAVASEADAVVDGLRRAFTPEVPSVAVEGGRTGSIQFILPRISKSDLDMFFQSLAAFEAADEKQRLLSSSLLLDQGIVLTEPSTRMEGMTGASVNGSVSWIAVPFTDIRGNWPGSDRTDHAA